MTYQDHWKRGEGEEGREGGRGEGERGKYAIIIILHSCVTLYVYTCIYIYICIVYMYVYTNCTV